MYIEVFLLDNFIFDMLIITTASALSRAPFSHIAATVVCIVLSVTAAFAQRLPFLRSLPVKLIMCGIAAVPFYVKYKKITIKPCIYIFAATFIIGGTVYALTNGTFSFASGYVRLFIYPAFVALFIPKIIRKIQKKRSRDDIKAIVTVYADGEKYTFKGIYDSGSELECMLTGCPVIMVYAPQLKDKCDIPVAYSDTKNASILAKGFMPDRVFVDDTLIRAVIVPTDNNPKMPAIVPWVCRDFTEKAEVKANEKVNI